tara:strand:- start:1555 stop:4269 length:2715 start_codon:yes stop_codon:yes gene_type:complete
MRKAIFSILALIVIGIIGYLLIPVDSTNNTSSYSVAINAIPRNAAFIIRTKNPENKWGNLKKTPLGKAISGFKSVQSINSFMASLDSIAKIESNINTTLHNSNSFISGHVSGLNTTSLLFTISNEDITHERVNSFLQKIFNDFESSEKTYEETKITCFLKNNTNICFAVLQNVLMMTNSSILIEKSVRQLKSGKSLSTNLGFRKLLKTSDSSLDANLFINYSEFGKSISSFSNNNFSPVKLFSNFGSWAEIDLNIKNQGLMLNGFSMANDSVNSYLSSFINEKAQPFLAPSILPENTGMMLYLSYNSFPSYYSKFEKHLAEKQILYKHQKNILNINKKYNFTVESDFFGWIGNEICLFSTEGSSDNWEESFGVAIKAVDIQKAKKGLKAIHNSTKNNSEIDYQNFKIKKLGLTNFFDLTIGHQFKWVTNSYYIILEDYVVFANSESNLKHIINSYLRGRTLVKNGQFNEFYNQFNDKSNFFFYNSFKKGNHLWKGFLNEELALTFDTQKDSLGKLGAIGLQINNEKKMFYTNIFLNYNSKKEAQSLSLTECKLDTSYSLKPWIVSNHNTKEKEILIQDNANKLYLINGIGKVIWQKKLDEKIIGNIAQVDRYKNHKLQYTFVTKNKFHQIDRNGKNVKGYPITLKSEVTKGLTLLDYDKNRDYRILITQGKNIHNFDVHGKLIKGWEFNSNANITVQPQLLQAAKKDYIIVADELGKVRILNRKGEDRIELNTSLPGTSTNFHIWKNNALSNSGVLAIDSTGTIHFVKLIDELETFTVKALSKGYQFFFDDFNGDKVMDFIVHDDYSISAYKTSKKLISKINDIDFKPSYGVQCFNLGKDKSIILIINKLNSKCFAYNEKGVLMDNFPIEGVTPACVADLNNDGNKKLIIGDKIGSVYIYSIVE